MNLSITGATGFIGQALSHYFAERGDEVTPITRAMLRLEGQDILQQIIDHSDVVINLAGESIDQPWSSAAKLRIIESRTITTRTIVAAINRSQRSKRLISTSAVGIYPSEGCYKESDEVPHTDSFLAEVCRAWEAEARELNARHSLAIARFGVVFSPDGGALPKMIATRKFGFIIRIGSPSRHISWIDRRDLVRAISHLVDRKDLKGIFNLCAPELTTQQLFLAATKSPIIIPLPESLFRVMRGEAADLVLSNCCAAPLRLMESGFEFLSPTIADFFNQK